MHYILIFGPCCPLIFQYLFTVTVTITPKPTASPLALRDSRGNTSSPTTTRFALNRTPTPPATPAARPCSRGPVARNAPATSPARGRAGRRCP